MKVLTKEELEEVHIITDEEFNDVFATEPIDENEIINLKNGIERNIIDICNQLGKYYDNLNLQKIAKNELKEFLILNQLKTKREIYLYLLYFDDYINKPNEKILTQLFGLLLSFVNLKERINKNGSLLLIDGNYCNSSNKILGYCHYKLHKGYITENLLEQHECLKKRCPLLEKYEDNSFWVKRKEIKKEKEQIIVEKKHNEETLLEYKKQAQEYADLNNYKLVITSVIKDNDRFYVYFVTDNNKNEEVKYCDISNKLKSCYNKYFIMKKVSKSDGNYATIKDIQK